MSKLTIDTIEDLFQVPYKQVLIYNHLDRSLGPVNCQKISLMGIEMDSIAFASKIQFEKMTHMYGRQIIMTAVRGVPQSDWGGMNQFQKTLATDEQSKLFAGNVIVFNHRTKMFESNPSGWFGINATPDKVLFNNPYQQMYAGLHAFMFRMWLSEYERMLFVEPFEKQK